jgi:hypothetical protein
VRSSQLIATAPRVQTKAEPARSRDGFVRCCFCEKHSNFAIQGVSFR